MHRIARYVTFVVRLLVAVALVGVVACDSDEGTPVTNPDAGRIDASRERTESCGDPSATRSADGPSAEMREIGTEGDVRVEAAVYPRPSYEGDP